MGIVRSAFTLICKKAFNDVEAPAIDRLAPRNRPAGGACGYQLWRSLLFMHWQAPRDVLRELVPRSLELDLFEDRAYVGLVPFSMQEVRPWWAPRAVGFDFLETNEDSIPGSPRRFFRGRAWVTSMASCWATSSA